jgi:4-hydroxy-4-methyl-2-oxoglutarate aldolase
MPASAARPLKEITPDRRSDLIALGAATLHEAQGQQGAMDHGIKPLDPRMRLAGPAFTIAARPGDNLVVHHALTHAAPGDVLVIDAGGYLEAGLWGDILTEAALQRGLAGLVVDGAVRDAEAICAAGFPVFARGLSIKGTLKNQPGRLQAAVTCGGVQIAPGDVVVGDRDGVVVIPRSALADTLAAGRRREREEASYREQIRSGRSTIEILNLKPAVVAVGLA